MSKITEKILLYKAQFNQDPDSFAKLYDLYVKQIYRFVYFKVSNHEEAEDITADVFLKAWNYIQEKKEIKSFSGLLYHIARNHIIDVYRARSTHGSSPLMVEEDSISISDAGAWEKNLETKLEHQYIVQALKKLKHEYREVITLRFIDELAIEEISQITNKSSISIRVTLHRALKKLKEILKQASVN